MRKLSGMEEKHCPEALASELRIPASPGWEVNLELNICIKYSCLLCFNCYCRHTPVDTWAWVLKD